MKEEYNKQPRVSPVSTGLVIAMFKRQDEKEKRREEVKCPKIRFRISEKTFNERYGGSCLRFEGPLQSEGMWDAIRRRPGEKADFPNDCFYAVHHNSESFSVTGKNLIGKLEEKGLRGKTIYMEGPFYRRSEAEENLI